MDLFAPATVAGGTPATLDTTTDEPRNVGLRRPNPTLLQRLGGVALAVSGVLFAGGMFTSPPQTSEGTAGYIESLAADPALSLVSANLLHYGWVALAIGGVSALGLLRSRRGRVFLPLAVAIVVFGAIQMSGLLLSDWFLVSAGNTLPIDLAVTMDAAAKDWSVGIWQYSGMIGGLLGTGILSLALARARAVSWWIAPLAFLPWILPPIVGGALGAVVGLVCFAPLMVAGVRLVLAR